MNFKRVIKYIFIALFSLIVSKYLVLWYLPSSFVPDTPVRKQSHAIKTTPEKTLSEKKEVELMVDYTDLKNKVENEYQKALHDMDRYIEEQMDQQRQRAYYQLSKDDGFLDWIFGYFIGYKLMWKKIKGYFGSVDNEVKMVSDRFQNDVIQPGFDTTIKNIQVFGSKRIEDYYKTVIAISTEYLNSKTVELKQQGYTNIQIEHSSIPWSQYIVSSSADGIVLLELTGVTSIGVIAGKFVGGKIAALLGPKMLTLISAKTVTMVAGKIAASFSLIFAPLVDLALNEVSKQTLYDNTKKDFEKIIDKTFDDVKKDINVHDALLEVKKSIYEELNQKTKIKANK